MEISGLCWLCGCMVVCVPVGDVRPGPGRRANMHPGLAEGKKVIEFLSMNYGPQVKELTM